jgi:hypothetical protein
VSFPAAPQGWAAAAKAAQDLVDAADNLQRYVGEVAEAADLGVRIDRRTVLDLDGEVTFLRRRLEVVATETRKVMTKHGW